MAAFRGRLAQVPTIREDDLCLLPGADPKSLDYERVERVIGTRGRNPSNGSVNKQIVLRNGERIVTNTEKFVRVIRREVVDNS